jgi:dihydroorotate dehydrogenase
MYKWLRNILFLFEAEYAHYFSMNILNAACKISVIKNVISKIYQPANLPTHALGLTFKNPVGLAAGFDKNARYLSALETLGFGFIEIGTVTPLPQKGNDKPRLFRLPEDKALINRMGFNNDGVAVVAQRLRKWPKANGQSSMQNGQRSTGNQQRLIIGGNIGKNKATSNEDAWKDYEICFLNLYDYVDYFVVNVSSPNTPGLRELQQKDSLRKILTHLISLRNKQANSKPVLLKIAPDLTWEDIDDIVDLSIEIKLDGIVISNTTLNKSGLQTPIEKLHRIGHGGLSGKPLLQGSTKMVEYISHKTNNKLLIIASGGIFAGEDANDKINAGAALVQVWTGFVYEGPAIIKNICRSLAYIYK